MSAEVWATLNFFPDPYNEELVGTDACFHTPKSFSALIVLIAEEVRSTRIKSEMRASREAWAFLTRILMRVTGV